MPGSVFAWNPAAAEHFRADRCDALLWNPAPCLLVTRVRGHASLGCLEFYTHRAEQEMPRGKLVVFHDWTEMDGYDPAARDEIKRWGKLHNEDFVSVEYLVRSKVVAMLVSVAALTLGRELRATTDRPEFLERLEAALALRRGPT